MRFNIWGPYRAFDGSEGKGRPLLGTVVAASEEAALKRWRHTHPEESAVEVYVESVRPRVDCTCPDCGWTFKGSGSFTRTGGQTDARKRCTLCAAKVNVFLKKKAAFDAQAALTRAFDRRAKEIQRRKARDDERAKDRMVECERCGRTVPKRRRPISNYCSERCATEQRRADRESSEAEAEYVKAKEEP